MTTIPTFGFYANIDRYAAKQLLHELTKQLVDRAQCAITELDAIRGGMTPRDFDEIKGRVDKSLHDFDELLWTYRRVHQEFVDWERKTFADADEVRCSNCNGILNDREMVDPCVCDAAAKLTAALKQTQTPEQ